MFYQKIIRPLLFLLPAEASHNVAIIFLKYWGKLFKAKTIISNPVKLMGLEFPNRIGLAAGLDKNGVAIDSLATIGFGFIEIGTVTPKPQIGNKKPRLFRLPKYKALINRMGFNNLGVDQLIENVKAAKYKGILGINIGKNAATSMDNAVDDYIYGLEKVYSYASYITINISSPNTSNLRDLQQGNELDNLLNCLKQRHTELAKQHNKYVPLALKIAPDLTCEQIAVIAELLLKHNIDAVIATNTALSRIGVENASEAKEQGGLSGEPIYPLSLQVVKQLAQQLNGKIPIIACGGISSAEQVQEMLTAGASLIQIYTGFIYQGPALIKKLLEELFRRKK